ncbi:unnamed protein product [Rotaria socialis]|uniref:Ty3 transposon capsid-like protein domain-containing protein n=6 Tax=Rotaria TaxID=231623 RepID=A0A8S3C0H2_9BILA|nr:unnamed protein product [Rotaria socialis]CAF4694225.1 unnamed protein product [Rotaria magnacalcarata]CAF4852749.1 unnamed protein product [Rotaria magnacalcarata]
MRKAESSASLDLPTTSDHLVLTSTLNPEQEPSSLSKLTRRMDIIPTPNRPQILVNSNVVQPIKADESTLMTTIIATEAHASSNNNHILHENQHDVLETSNLVHSEQHQLDHKSDTEGDDNTFDSFICENFVPFSGTEPLHQWLDHTDAMFRRFKISRYLRFQAIPLLVQGNAKRIYIKNRHSITSFDDFYAFLLDNFDTSVTKLNTAKSSLGEHHVEFSKDFEHINNKTTDSKSACGHTTDVTQQLKSCVSNFSKLEPNDTATITGDVSDSKLTDNTSLTTCSSSDAVTRDLRKAIMSDFIKNPRVFRGGKDSVKKWIEDIEHLMEIAHVPESTRLDLIPYALRSDALQWYKNNKSTLTSWTKFLEEIRKTFLSSFSEEMAFKSLESYSQGEHQSVQNFFNEVVKLCKEADPNMSDSTKLKNLLNKIKPTIQYEVRKKKPKSISEFLEFAKEAEELLQLTVSTININSAPRSVTSVSFHTAKNSLNNTSSNSSQNFNNDRNLYKDKNFRADSLPSSVAYNSSYSPRYDRTASKYTSGNFRPNQNKSFASANYANNSYTNNKKFALQHRNKFSHNTPKSQSSSANVILSSNSSSCDNNLDESFLATICDICQESGHEASTCQNFQ